MKHLVTFSTERPLQACAEVSIDLRSETYLADHGLQGMSVLPGSCYIEMARRLERESFKRVPGVVRNVTFCNPIMLAAEKALIRVDVLDRGDGRVEYTFHEAGAGHGGERTIARQVAARLEIDRNPPSSPGARTDAFSIQAFQAQSHSVIDAQCFYGTLRENGNQYGPSFQRISSIWRAGDHSLARLSVARRDASSGPDGLHPSLLDSMTQLLASFILDKGRTFILRSIEKVEVAEVDFPDLLWSHAVLMRQGAPDGESLVGDVRIFDQSGKTYARLAGVAFAFLERVEPAEEKTAAKLVIASNFTAEPIEDALDFWSHHLGVPIRLEFAPYDQVFQQLLDQAGALRGNRDGINVILLGLEEWAAGDRHAVTPLGEERAAQCFGDRSRTVLPNGMEIVHLHRYETDYLYQEIFADQCYLRHGVRLRDGDTVVDIGANIGLFSLFVAGRCRNARIYAFEPAPAVYELLRANCAAHAPNARALNLGVSDRPKTASFTYYEKSSVFSGFHADESGDREAIRTVVRNMLQERTSVAGEAVEEYVDELTAGRLGRRIHECRLTTVSDIIRENGIDSIDLLKIDAEKSELDIIAGIEERDWPKISQIVIEIHDRSRAAVARIEDLLMRKGYRCVVAQETLLEHAGLFNLYATRARPGSEAASAAAPAGLARNVRDFGAALRSFMHEAAVPLVLCVCPRTPAAAADADLRAALDDAEQALLAQARAIPNVHAIDSASPLQRYPVDDYYDAHSHRLGHVPYTPECYAAIGTALFRTILGMAAKPYKVIVLDCDNTLWQGVCGEDGPLGIEISTPYRRLQEFMLGRMNAGMLLCLCSKNDEKDVLEVFDRRADMVLQREHLVSWRINWNSKSDNIKSLANELNLGLDSFIFVDDNPVDCADVRINCPGVLTLQLPRDSGSLPSFLDHVWAFDHAGATEEDRHRTRMYRESTRRQEFLEQSLSLKDFVRGLQLRVEIAEATADQLGRIAQLTCRTNQFNFTSIRRSESEIRDFLERAHAHCLAVRVADRFGDYGLVGVALYETQADRYRVDSLLLSCRVLGRGVEHALVSQLGQRAAGEGKRFVEFTCLPTGRNLPALEFIASIGARYRNEAGTCWTIPAEHLASTAYDAEEKAPIGQPPPASFAPQRLAPRPAAPSRVADRSVPLQRIAEDLRDIDRLATAIEQYRLGKQALPAASDPTPGSTLETALAGMWRKVLGRPRIGMNDNFFEAGGTSLKAVQLLAMIRKELNQTLSIVSLFESPTVALLAARLQSKSAAARLAPPAAGAALRGQRRRNKAIRQQAA